MLSNDALCFHMLYRRTNQPSAYQEGRKASRSHCNFVSPDALRSMQTTSNRRSSPAYRPFLTRKNSVALIIFCCFARDTDSAAEIRDPGPRYRTSTMTRMSPERITRSISPARHRKLPATRVSPARRRWRQARSSAACPSRCVPVRAKALTRVTNRARAAGLHYLVARPTPHRFRLPALVSPRPRLPRNSRMATGDGYDPVGP